MNKIPLVIIIILIAVLTVFSQTGTGSLKGISLADSSQIYVQQIINSKIPVLADFWAVWCGPCKLLAPIIEEIKTKYKGKIKIIKINVDRNRSLATYFRVVSIPSVFIIKDKIVFKQIMGVQPKSVYLAAVNEVLEPETPKADSLK